MNRPIKYKVGDHVVINNPAYACNKDHAIVIGYDETYDSNELSYKLHFPDSLMESTMKESDLIAFEESPKTPNENQVQINFNIAELLTEEKIIELAKEALTKHITQKCDSAFLNRASAHKHGIVDEIVVSVGTKYADDMFKDENLKQKFHDQILDIIKCEIDREKPIDENYDLFRQQIEWKLQNFGEKYINDNPDVIIGFMMNGIKETAEKIASCKFTELIKKQLDDFLAEKDSTPK